MQTMFDWEMGELGVFVMTVAVRFPRRCGESQKSNPTAVGVNGCRVVFGLSGRRFPQSPCSDAKGAESFRRKGWCVYSHVCSGNGFRGCKKNAKTIFQFERACGNFSIESRNSKAAQADRPFVLVQPCCRVPQPLFPTSGGLFLSESIVQLPRYLVLSAPS